MTRRFTLGGLLYCGFVLLWIFCAPPGLLAEEVEEPVSAVSAAPVAASSRIDTQVLRVLSTKPALYYHKPWKSPDFSTVRGSGFFFKDEVNFPGMKGLILTNAHTVSMAQTIKVSNGREKQRYSVKMVGICNMADFAVLQMEPEDQVIYEKRNGPIEPLELGNSDSLRVGDKVLGWGYPLGGEGISKSEQGEINRIEVASYAHSQERWLLVQASLQQNRGNSGGPVLKNDRVVGISFQAMRTADRLNYFIPIDLVKRLFPLLNKQELVPRWRFLIQFMFPKLRDYYNLGPDQGGVLIDYLIPDDGPDKFGLKRNDILVSIDDNDIDDYGEIFFKPLDQKVFFSEVLNRKKVGDPLKIKVIRAGKVIELNGPMTKGLPKLVSTSFTRANYFILAGVGFVELTVNCIENLEKTGESLKAKYGDEFPKRPYQKIVIISEIFPEYELVDTSGYLKRVMKVNGEDVLNLEQLYTKLAVLKEKGEARAILELAQNVQLPLDLQQAPELDKQIQKNHGILYMKTPGGFVVQ